MRESLVFSSLLLSALLWGAGLAVAGSVELDPAASAELDLARDEVYTAVKQLGAEPDVLVAALARLSDEAAEGRVDDASIQDVTGTIADFDVAMKIESLLRGYAEQAAKRPRLAALLEPGTLEPLDPLDPLNGGTCLTCPSFDFGPFTPTLTWQFHSESTDSSSDCNVYQFSLTPGRTYEFSLCMVDRGGAVFDTVIELHDASSCALIGSNDDDCLPQSKITWRATTDLISLRVRGFSGSSAPPWAFGSYTLAYRQTPCPTCANPFPTLLVPTTTCQAASAPVDSTCPDLFWRAALTAGSTYEFTTCPLTCTEAACTTVPDTVLDLYAPGSIACTSASGDRVASNDDAVPSCTGSPLRSRLVFTPTVTGAFTIRARSLAAATAGTICMGYRQVDVSTCPNTCASGPFLATLVPTPTCQSHSSAIVAPCSDAWYLVDVRATGPHEFALCSASCPGGNATFDSRIELYDSACTLIAADDDGCGAPRARLLSNVPATGTYRLRVSAVSGAGPYTLNYRTMPAACTVPSNVRIRPAWGIASSAINSCSLGITFTVTSSGTSPMTYYWSIIPPAGGATTPASGATLGASSPSNPASFSSTLVRQGVYTVNVSAVNACGSSSASIGFQLLDRTAPVFTSFPPSTSVQCDSIPPAPALSASDNCDPNPVETFSETITPGSCPGRYTITRTWSATDLSGNVSAPRSQVLNVVDRTPPSIVPDTTVKYCLYPPNHELGCFVLADFSPVILESCSGPVVWRFTGVLNSEQVFPGVCPPGDVDPDIVMGAGGSSFCVRAERCGTDPSLDDGRTYLVFATATDACGNTSQPRPIGAILVPHDTADTSNCITP